MVSPPVWRASTHLYPNMTALRAGTSANADGRFYYGRRGAPTQWALAEALTEIEPGAAGTVLYPSGVAAIALVAGGVRLGAFALYDLVSRGACRTRHGPDAKRGRHRGDSFAAMQCRGRTRGPIW